VAPIGSLVGFAVVRIVVLVNGGQVETLQISPLLRTLSEGLPEATITVACPPLAAGLAEYLQGVSNVLPMRSLGQRAAPTSWIADWLRLRRHRFDVAIVCGGAARVRSLAYLAGIARRLGPAGGLTTPLLSDHIRPGGGENPCGVWLRLARLLGISIERNAPRVDPGAIAIHRAVVRLNSTSLTDGRLLVAVAPGDGFSEPGTPGGNDRWEPERWAHLANQLAMRHGAGIVFVGARGDADVVERAVTDTSALNVNLCGEFDLIETAALIGLCDLFISTDSPLLHLAAGVGTPTVGLFGPTRGRQRGPYGGEHRVIQALPQPKPARGGGATPQPASSLMRLIRVEDVLAAIESEGN